MKSGHHADVEAAKLGSLLSRRHVHASHFGQVSMFGGGARLRSRTFDWRDLHSDDEQCDRADERNFDHVRPSQKNAHAIFGQSTAERMN